MDVITAVYAANRGMGTAELCISNCNPRKRPRAPREEKLSQRAYSSLAYVNFPLNRRVIESAR